jgi:hypothetical protein
MPRKQTLEEFIFKAKKKHGDKYDYSNVVYINNHTQIQLKCNKCMNIFFITPKNHFKCGKCRKCYNNIRSKTQEEFKNQLSNKYEVLDDYITTHDKIRFKCIEHNEIFFQRPHHILKNIIGCKECYTNTMRNLHGKTSEEFIKTAHQIHDDKYDYSNTKYINNRLKVEIICKKHGVFFQIPKDHLNGSGCRYCKNSNGEKKILTFLETQKIQYHVEKTFENCVYKRNLRFDFYIPEVNCLIEYDGMQHFKDIKYFSNFEKLRIKDIIKNKFCLENNIPLLRIAYTDYKFISTLIKSFINRVKHGFMGIVYSNPSLYKK